MAAYLDDYFGGKVVPLPAKTTTTAGTVTDASSMAGVKTTTPANTVAPTSGVVPGNVTPVVTKTTTPATAFIGPIPGDSIRTTTGYTYEKKTIWDRNGNQVEVWASGPQAGYAVDGGYLVLQGEAPTNGSNAPAGSPGKAWIWNGTQWVKPAQPGAGNFTWDDNNGWTKTNNSNDNTPNTNIAVLRASLLASGIPSSVIDNSVSYLTQVLQDLDGDVDNASEVFLNLKEYTTKDGTKLTSPFYAEYGYLNEGLANPKTPSELFNFVKGAKDVITKYGLDAKFTTQESLKQYVANSVTVEDLDARGNLYRLKSLQADPNYVSALVNMGYISSAQGLQDFFANPKIGKEVFTSNAATAGIATEAIKRAGLGIKTDKARFEALAASLVAQGYSPDQAQAKAAQSFTTIGEELNPMVKLTGIYDKAAPTDANVTSIQSELEQEEFMGLASAKRKRIKGTEEASFQAQSGLSQYALGTSSTSMY
jgi:hypothetical protein